MDNKLIEKMEKIQTALKEKKEIGAYRLERFSAEMKTAFDEAIDGLFAKSNFLKEIDARRAQLREWRIGVIKTIWPINYKYLASMPFIYGMSVPMVFFHAGLELYHQVCFRIYRIPRVKTGEYFVFDRQMLPYLNWLEKINCVYCSYANNLFRYASEIGGRTERFWCPIKYSKRVDNPHSQYDKFVDYLDGENFRDKWQKLRDFSDMEGGVGEKGEEKKCDFVK